MKRAKHSLSHYVLSTFDMGKLIPVCNFEVLPGDSIRMSSSCLLRVSPLMTPVMHPCVVRLHHWFVPYRIIWDEWENFITGGSDGEGDGAVIPTVDGATIAGPASLADYFGLPPNMHPSTEVNLFPFYAYNKIYNEFYRDQDLVAPVADDNITVLNIAWEKDYFTSARPWTQKGPDVVLPLGTSAPVVSTGGARPTFQNATNAYGQLRNANAGVEGVGVTTNQATIGDIFWLDPGLQADLSNASGASINDVRRAFAIQRYQEARAQYGSRYTEYLRYLGVRSSDARLQRPEYLGGGRSTISFSEVLRTGDDPAAPDPEAPIGEMRGHGISAMRSRRFIRFFEEHGIVMTLASIRPRTMYRDAIHRGHFRRTKEDFWQRELEQIGQQEITDGELWAETASPNEGFGFQDRYAEYRHLQSYVTGDFRTTLSDWHLARAFASLPTLNQSFIECDPSKRIFADQTSSSIWGMFSHSIQARRMVGHKTIGRLY